ncbi:MAG: hypothetical protein IKL62_05915 [Clostridia bacterium]|nr:hypothetical protein [Clostridia bacterium]
MKRIFKILIIVGIIFVFGVVWNVVRLLIETKPLKIDESVLDIIAETDWSDTNLLEAKEMFFNVSDGNPTFSGIYGEGENNYHINITLADPDDNAELISYKNIKYSAAEHTALSFKNIFSSNDNVERYLTVYVDGIKISVTEYNKSKNAIAFYNFFKENTQPKESKSSVAFYHETEMDYSEFIAKNKSDKNVGEVSNENIAAEKATELWVSDLGAEAFIGGPEISVYCDTSKEYWIIVGYYPKDILSKKYTATEKLPVPTTIIAFDGRVIANGLQ